MKEIQGLIHRIAFENKTSLTFCWIPSHCGITGNEKADKEARIAADIQRECIQPISALDMKPYIKNQILSLWLEKWNSLTQNKLKKNGGKIGEKSFSNFYSRLDEIKFTRIRLGHTRLTHSYFFTESLAPICEECQCLLTVFHILCTCPRFENERLLLLRNLILSRQNIRGFLNRSNPSKNHEIIKFLKETDLYKEI